MARTVDTSPLFEDDGLNKFQRKQLEIAEAAIKCYDRYSIEGTHFGNIADELGVTRPLIKHYFKDPEQLAVFAIKYIRLQLEQMVLDKAGPVTNPVEKFDVYIDEALSWPAKKKVHARVWCNFLQMCSRDKEHMAINAQYVRGTQERIAAMLTAINRGSLENNMLKAKLIEIILGGALVTLLSEPIQNPDDIVSQVHDLIWQVARN